MSEETFISDGKLEAKVVGKNENDKGWYLRLLLHPSDVEEITKLRFGAVLDIRWREVLNVEVEPIEIPSQRGTTLDQAFVEPAAKGGRGDSRERPAQPKKRFEDYPLSAQCAMVCDEPAFHRFLELYLGVPYGPITSSAAAATAVRSECRVTSRAELDKFPDAANAWRELYRHYQAYITDSKYAAVRR